MPETIQPFANLDAATEAALRASIVRFGVIIPVVKDQHGRILDGNQRARIAGELGVTFDEIIVKVADEDEAREYARTLNEDRRHLTPDQRREVVGALRSEGHSLRAIAGAVGVSEPTVRRDVAIASPDAIKPERVIRQGGGTYPASRPRPVVIVSEAVPSPVWDALLDIIRRIETLPAEDLIIAAVPVSRHMSTAKKLRKAGGALGRVAWKIEQANQPTPEEQRAKRDAEAAARPAKAAHELELAKANLAKLAAAPVGDPARHRDAMEKAQTRVQLAEDEVLILARKAEDRERWAARSARDVTPADA